MQGRRDYNSIFTRGCIPEGSMRKTETTTVGLCLSPAWAQKTFEETTSVACRALNRPSTGTKSKYITRSVIKTNDNFTSARAILPQSTAK